MLRESDLIELGFKRRQKNKQKFLVYDEVTLSKQPDGTFLDVNTNVIYMYYNDMVDYISILELTKTSEIFKAGLPEINLRQGNFNNVYKDSSDNQTHFISHEMCKKLLEAKFNMLISGPLMLSNSEPNYDYRIIEAKYYFLDKDILTLCYHFKDSKGWHDFYHTFKVFKFDYNDYVIKILLATFVRWYFNLDQGVANYSRNTATQDNCCVLL